MKHNSRCSGILQPRFGGDHYARGADPYGAPVGIPGVAEADAMHALLIKHADELVGCTEGSPEEAELSPLAEVIDAYEAKRWPSGKAAARQRMKRH